jgi:hypothetical protein
MKLAKSTGAMLAVGLLLIAALPGCERDEGPLERAGEKIDEAVDEVLHPNEGPLEKAGRKTDEAVESVREKLE